MSRIDSFLCERWFHNESGLCVSLKSVVYFIWQSLRFVFNIACRQLIRDRQCLHGSGCMTVFAQWKGLMMDWKILNRNVIEEFRINSGRVAQFGDLPVVILNTIGAKTGNLLEVPLITVIDDGHMYVFGTNAGAKKQPVWIYNLRANPVIDVEFKTEVIRANLTELDGQQRKDRIQIQSQQTPQFADYIASSAPRQVAVFRIDPL